MVVSSTPIFATSDVLETIRFYKEVLGFESSWTYGDPVSFGSVSWAGATIMFNLQPGLAARVDGHQHWFKCEEVDELYRLHKERGATIVSPIQDQPWGAREYVVRDPSGYHLRFAGSPVHSAEKSRDFPVGVQIVRRKPTETEFLEVAGQTFYHEGVPSGVLERSWSGIVALSPEGRAIGTVRIMYDAPGWFSIWDVAVLPDWQGQRIGERMMKEAIALVNEASPGAFVYLFTFKHGFYERLGFTTETVTMRKV
ncbi:MAG: GNAT family N-acetyltransferase [Fimbriimonas sp.]